MDPHVQFSSFAHEGVLISGLIPDGWEAFQVEPNQVRLMGPQYPEHGDYLPSFSISLGSPEGYGEEWFASFCAESVERMQAGYQGFTLRDSEQFTLSSLVEVHATWFEWEPAPGLYISQLQALALADRYRMYLIDGATLQALAELHLPLFNAMLRGLRILQPR